MRTETRTYTIYTLSELTEEARQKAYSDWLSHSEYDWADENAAALKKFEQIFNIEVRSWNYDGCTYGYRFVSHYSGEVEEMHGARLVAYLMNNYWHHLFLRKTYRNKDFTHKRSSRIFYDTDCVLTGYCADNALLRPIYDYLRRPDGTTFYDLLDRCLDSFFRYCREDVQFCQSEEAFRENAEANDWEYFPDGTMYN